MVNKGVPPRVDYRAAVCRLDAAGWVLGALDPGDAERFAEHLLTCRTCQRTVAELEPPGAARRLLNPRAAEPAGLAAATLARIRAARAAAEGLTTMSRPLHPESSLRGGTGQ